MLMMMTLIVAMMMMIMPALVEIGVVADCRLLWRITDNISRALWIILLSLQHPNDKDNDK